MKSALKKKSNPTKISVEDVLSQYNIKDKSEIPLSIKPMLATLVDEATDAEGWIYELKWDGFRAIGIKDEKVLELKSRNDKSFNDKFYPLYSALKELPFDGVLDGEVVVLNHQGLPDFAALQTWRSEADGTLAFYVFDLLWINGRNLMNTPLETRRTILRQVLSPNGMIRMSDNFNVKGSDFFSLANKMNLEGIIAKKADSLYTPDVRSKNWLKIKTQKFQEAIICGYTKNENTSKLFSALMMGIYEGKELVFIGPVGTGFTMKMQKEILEKLQPLKIKACPFKEVPEYNKPSRFRPNPPKAEIVWVKPELVAEVSYRTVSPGGALRHPSFKGLREDKNAREVMRETVLHTSEVIEKENILIKNKVIKTPGKKDRKTLLNPTEETQVRVIDGHSMKFPNLSKIYWPEDNVTKRDMLNYYYQVVPYLLPYLKDRPQTLNRFPNGIHGESFYQKDITGKAPDWIESFPYYSHTDKREKKFLVCTNEASLLYIASLGCIEMNPWSSRIQHPDHPDWCIIDLDPDQNTFDQVIEAAQVTKQILDSIGVPSFCKTSGSTGMHIYIPLGAKYDYEESKEFARALAKTIHAEIPSYTSIERITVNRNGKMYIDFLQNRPQATVAGPYSLRPKPGATVSMPLHWDEVKKGIKMKDFNIHNSINRLKEEGDIFKGVLGKGINIEKAKAKLSEINKGIK